MVPCWSIGTLSIHFPMQTLARGKYPLIFEFLIAWILCVKPISSIGAKPTIHDRLGIGTAKTAIMLYHKLFSIIELLNKPRRRNTK